MQGLFKNNRNIFEAGLKKKVTPYEWGKEVAPGLLAVDTIGHTPGHTSYVLSSGSGKVYHPVRCDQQSRSVRDQSGLARVLRPGRRYGGEDPPPVYDMVVAEKLQVQGFHYPFPGLGNVEKDGSGYRVIPAPWNPSI